MPALQPSFAASLADDVYNIETEFQREALADKYKNELTMQVDKPTMTGKSGALVFIKKETAFGMAALGKGDHKNEAFVTLRGTASLFDALTDLNAGVKVSHTGAMVHQGFYYTFDSLLPELKGFMQKCGSAHTIHCMGHSLGGALATLAADWINKNSSATVKLYTFGSPRVGLNYFAERATTNIGVENIFRTYHRTDPVPMVPTWPFTHVPDNSSDYLLDSPTAFPPWKYHGMGHYIESVRNKDWRTLKSERPAGDMELAAMKWLSSEGPVDFTFNTIGLLNAALMYVVKKIINLAGIVLVGGFATTFTLLDRLAILMHKAIDFSKDLSYWVVRLVTKIMQALGMAKVKTTSMTASFIRMVFMRLHSTVTEFVRKASRYVL